LGDEKSARETIKNCWGAQKPVIRDEKRDARVVLFKMAEALLDHGMAA
jgi:hypothetical protein